MGANAQTSVPTFTTGQVLTAAQQNQINTGVPVFADTTARDAAFGGTGEKVLAEGQLAYIEASDVVQYYNGSTWATLAPASAGALTLISATTIGSAVSSVTVSSAFSATYDNYLILITGGTPAGSGGGLSLQLGATTSGYYWSEIRAPWGGTITGSGGSNSANWTIGNTSNVLNVQIDLQNPFLTEETTFQSRNVYTDTGATGRVYYDGGYLNNTTSYTAFTLAASGFTLTGGTIRVYGYANS
jgi:hypothetical protein